MAADGEGLTQPQDARTLSGLYAISGRFVSLLSRIEDIE